ncbi:MAG: Transcriptional regulator DegU, LuxR family [Candidatus Carbobacillus altaicus]|uniref:Transcriptional regulator DegU, LuxR family n=1 Tax=Candidatus Carbonibacillus altaicus TaxID=2163959 RepID=A0A2R6Y006_9BACL|nr:MAG: Transcriptional regulator DegU, LuxR family [Candidatus Carbobacillus altaicus]
MREEQITVLIADDHQLFREGLRKILSMTPDIQVVGEASDGQTTLKKVAELHPDVVLMDINMPILSGVETTQKIHEHYPETKVIILSIHDDEQYVYKSLSQGASGYVLKEVDSDTLIQAIRVVAAGQGYIHPRVTPMVIKEVRRLHHFHTYGANVHTEVDRHDGWDMLTDREREVVRLIARGLTNRDIGDALGISDKTVKNHISNILSKLNINDRKQLIVRALQNGWNDLER